MLRPNIALVVPRNYQAGQFDAAIVSRFVTDVKTGESTRGSYCYPLYLYDAYADTMFEGTPVVRLANLDEIILASLAKHVGLAFLSKGCGDLVSRFGPEDVLGYVYAILYSSNYRLRYAALIKNDFPRIPLTVSGDLFRGLVRLGRELVAIHLLESPNLAELLTTYFGPANPEVGRVAWSDNTVWLDAPPARRNQPVRPGTIGFCGVPEEVWNFRIGGYHICHKWLKDRKGRTLTDDDIADYQKITVALNETIRVMGEIDEVIEEHGGWPGAFVTDPAPTEDLQQGRLPFA